MSVRRHIWIVQIRALGKRRRRARSANSTYLILEHHIPRHPRLTSSCDNNSASPSPEEDPQPNNSATVTAKTNLDLHINENETETQTPPAKPGASNIPPPPATRSNAPWHQPSYVERPEQWAKRAKIMRGSITTADLAKMKGDQSEALSARERKREEENARKREVSLKKRRRMLALSAARKQEEPKKTNHR